MSGLLITPFTGNMGGYVYNGAIPEPTLPPLTEDTHGLCLFIDVGTNGEIVLGNDEFMLACACSAGPAFEGGGIRHGMRAAAGAIERVSIDPVTKTPALTVIGGGAPTGICGSGMISLIAEMFNKGVIDPRGRFADDAECYVLYENDKTCDKSLDGTNFILHENDKTRVAVYENDIQNIIRAKAAIFSACRTLLRSVGMTFADVTGVYIAGGFGSYIDVKDAAAIGLLPAFGSERFRYVGNASLAGAYLSLVSDAHLRLRDELTARVTYVDLSDEPAYMDEYTAALFLPHTDMNAVHV